MKGYFMEGVIIFFLFCLVVLAIANTIFLVSSSVVLTKIYSAMILKDEAERVALEKRKNNQGLVDVNTSQIPFYL